jgi:hypothetical protein
LFLSSLIKQISTIRRQSMDAMVFEIAPQPGMKKDPNAPHIARLAALLDILGYGGCDGQKRFADEIGVNYNDFNEVATGYPLSTIVAFAIKARFRISLDFLWHGDYEALPAGLERKLRDWERRHGRRIFADYGSAQVQRHSSLANPAMLGNGKGDRRNRQRRVTRPLAPDVTNPAAVAKPKAGRPRIGEAPMTAAERMRRYRERKAATLGSSV